MTPAGKPISRAEAIRVSGGILERAELERVAVATPSKLTKLLRRLSWRGWKIRPIVRRLDPKDDPHYLHRREKP